jgi:hypothetical protein
MQPCWLAPLCSSGTDSNNSDERSNEENGSNYGFWLIYA